MFNMYNGIVIFGVYFEGLVLKFFDLFLVFYLLFFVLFNEISVYK